MKIAITAICKNESSNVKAFLETVRDADHICIVDTGSTDGTPDIIEAMIAKFEMTNVRLETAIFEPFSFSTARNFALHCTEQSDCDFNLFVDFDERLSLGWYDQLVAILTLHEGKYNTIGTYMNLIDAKGNKDTRYVQHKGHKLGLGVSWKYSAHEIFVFPEDVDRSVVQTTIELTHHKDESKKREYLKPLYEDYIDYPYDHRCIFYYGRELYYAGKFPDAMEVLLTAGPDCHGYFIPQQLEVYRLLYKCSSDAKYLYQAITLNQLSPEIYYDLALHHYNNSNYNACIGYVELLTRSIKRDNLSDYGVIFKDPSVATWKMYDLLSLSYWNQNDLQKAVYCIAKALAFNPTDARLIQNMMKFKQEADKEHNSGDSTEPKTDI